jgi:hypothetical protein
MADPMSWTNPGRVSGAERAAPPISEACSYTQTSHPARAN